MKELLKELGFEHLPMLSEFVKAIKTDNIFGFAMSETKDFQLDYAKKMAKELDTINEYTDFITQPLTKGMFLPCSEDGEVLIEHIMFPANLEGSRQAAEHVEKYQQAKKRVLFENKKRYKCSSFDTFGDKIYISKKTGKFYESNTGYDWEQYKTIEQAINNGVKLKLNYES